MNTTEQIMYGYNPPRVSPIPISTGKNKQALCSLFENSIIGFRFRLYNIFSLRSWKDDYLKCCIKAPWDCFVMAGGVLFAVLMTLLLGM